MAADSGDKKKPMVDTVNPHRSEYSINFAVEKKNNWSESCNCIMFNIHGWVWSAVPTLPLSSPPLMKIAP